MDSVDPTDSVPLHEQVAAQIRRALIDGEAGPGERLPPARDMATVLGVNANTVLRALRQLRDEGLVEFRRGRGITVSGAAPARSAVITGAKDLLRLARHQGVRREELVAIIEGLP
jgi:GntR family transcriptional regulator